MPRPRARGVVKTLRDAHITQSFFGQETPCPCSNRSCPHKVGGPSRTESLSAESSSALSDHQQVLDAVKQFLPKGLERVRNQLANDGLTVPPDSNVQAICTALQACFRLINDPNVKAEAFASVTTWDLKLLGEVEVKYEKACVESEQREAHERRKAENELQKWESLLNKNLTSNNTTLSMYLRMRHSYYRCMWRINDLTAQILLGCFRPTQLFNVEKRFGFWEESLAPMVIHNKNGPRTPWPNEPRLTFRQMIENPEGLIEKSSMATSRKQPRGSKGDENNYKQTKKLDWSDLISAFHQNCKEIAELAKAQNKAMDSRPTKVRPARTWTEDGRVDIPGNMPARIRRRLLDLEFVSLDVQSLNPLLSKLRDRIHSILIYWFTTSREAWRYGKNHVHEMPMMRKYEYYRISLAALHTLATREYLKVVKFFKSRKGSSYLTPSLAKVLNFDEDKTFEQIEADCGKLVYAETYTFASVDQIVDRLDGMLEAGTTLLEEDKAEWWTHVLSGKSPSNPLGR